MSDTVMQAAALILPLIFAIVFHEVAHGLMARSLGDSTAEEQGRLSLNPLRHVDPIGTVLVPGALKLMGLPVFGWAKPVPVNFARLRHPRSGMMLVAAAGPGSNLIMAALSALALGLVLRPFIGAQEPSTAIAFILLNLSYFIQINVFLALFNLLPIPPFDGSHIVEGLLPAPLAAGYAKFRAVGMLIPILLLVVLPQFIPGFNVTQYIVGPVDWVLSQYAKLTALTAGV